MLRKLRIFSAVIFWVGITFLFLDFTGLAHRWLGWMAKVQFLPALLAGNFIIIAALLPLTLLFGRLYCSVICPLGIMQDGFASLGRKAKRNRYGYSRPHTILRYAMLAVMAVAVLAGLGTIVALLAPYSSYGRIATNLLQPVWMWGNNLLASWAEHHDSYAFYEVDVWIKSVVSLAVASATLIVLAVLAWRNGRTYCNTICPVGTLLGLVSRFSIFRPVIDTSKCINCGKCARNCKSACINAKEHSIDYSRCVTCFDCIGMCSTGAITYTRRRPSRANVGATGDSAESKHTPDKGRRAFLSVAAVAGTAAVASAQIKLDGGLAVIEDKRIPARKTPIVPPGAVSIKHLADHCTGCQLCIAACPNGVLRPSTSLGHLFMPVASYERGYCRPECTRCGDVCPAGAILKITPAEKTAISVGHAVWVKENCLPATDGVKCGNCARHCPTGAIKMVHSRHDDSKSPMIPTVDAEKCIGCGACENLCPARPLSAIYVEGNSCHIER